MLKKTVESDKTKLSISQLFSCISTFKKTAARLRSELEFEQTSLGLQAVFHSLTASFLRISPKAHELKKLNDN